MAQAKKNGESTVSVFVRLSKAALKGDMTKLPLLFGDKEVLLGMQSSITSGDSLMKFLRSMEGMKVKGAVFNDLRKFCEPYAVSSSQAVNS